MPRLSPLFRLFALLGAMAVGGCTSTSNSDPRSPARARVAPATTPRDAYVLLSGGGSPLSNNYSQYLQARAVADYFNRELPAEATWVFFGAGNRDDAPPVLADARRELKQDGLIVQSWVPGALPRNRPATKDSFLRALRDEILPTVSGGGTLYLIVGDHGELVGKDEKRESAITMWQLKRGRRRSTGWYTDEKEVLGVAELRQVLAAGLGRGRMVFCMTQCHSGGFNELGLAREMTPPRSWFSSPPPWAGTRATGMRLPVAGFTATDEASLAAGCDADPDPEKWAGYERFMPESFIGIDLMSGQRKGGGAGSLAAAHEAAVLIDHTIDKPRSTSEHYLDGWARLIETRLATTLSVTAQTQRAVAGFQRALDTGRVTATDAALRARQMQFARFTEQLAAQVPAARDVLLAGTQQQLDAVLRGRGSRGGGGPGPASPGGTSPGNRRAMMAELRKVWTDTLRPAWKSAVLAGSVPELSGAVLEFERHLTELEDDDSNFLLPRGNNDTPLLNEIYWQSGHGEPAKFDPARAAAIARWGAERRARIIAWGKKSADVAVSAAAEKIGPGPAFTEEAAAPMSRRTAAERVMFYRRVLAAWEFLIAMDAQPALAELHALIELERTPLRPTAAPVADR